MSKVASKAMEFEKTPVSKVVRNGVIVKDIERTIDNLNLGRLLWYIAKRYKMQISVLINVAFVATPVIKFIHGFLG